MAVIFVKNVNGNVEFTNDDGVKYSLPPEAVVQENPHDADIININSPGYSKFKVDWNDVTAPVVLSRAALFTELKNNFFFPLAAP